MSGVSEGGCAAMEFSAPLRCGLTTMSPDGAHLATTLGVRLTVFGVVTQQEVAAFICLDDPQASQVELMVLTVVEWSPDSTYLLTACLSRRAVQLWSIDDADWRCRIDEADIGLAAARWAPSSRHVLTISELSLRVTVWSLVDEDVCYIKYVKDVSGVQFSPDGHYLAVVERRSCTDHVGLFSTRAWHLVKHMDDVGQDVAGLSWSPDSQLFCLWDGWNRFRLAIYDVVGRRLGELELSGCQLGVSTVQWCPSGQLLAVASYDDTVRLVNHVTWGVLTTLSHSAVIRAGAGLRVYKERQTKLTGFRLDLALAAGADCVTDVTYELCERRPVLLKHAKSAGDSAKSRQGVGRMLFSHDNRFLATRYDVMPECVWIWSTADLSLHTLLVHGAAVRDLVWDPCAPRLAVCTGSRYLYMWSVHQSSTCRSPADIHISQMFWPDESNILLQGKDTMVFCRLDDGQSENGMTNST